LAAILIGGCIPLVRRRFNFPGSALSQYFVIAGAVVDKKISGRRRACRILSKEEELIVLASFLAGFGRFDNLKGRNYEKTFVWSSLFKSKAPCL